MRSAVRVADRNPDKNQTGTPNKFKNDDASRQKQRKEKTEKPCGARERGNNERKTGKMENVQKVIGKDEVPSSNLGSSSKKLSKSLDFESFFSYFVTRLF